MSETEYAETKKRLAAIRAARSPVSRKETDEWVLQRRVRADLDLSLCERETDAIKYVYGSDCEEDHSLPWMDLSAAEELMDKEIIRLGYDQPDRDWDSQTVRRHNRVR